MLGWGLFRLADLVCGHVHVTSVPTLLKKYLSGFCHIPVSTVNMPQDLDLCHCIQHFTWIQRPDLDFQACTASTFDHKAFSLTQESSSYLRY